VEVKPITLFVHEAIYNPILSSVPKSELNNFYAKALWNVFFKRPFGEVIKNPFDYSSGVPVRFIPDLPTYLKWVRLPKAITPYVIEAFDSEVFGLLANYEW